MGEQLSESESGSGQRRSDRRPVVSMILATNRVSPFLAEALDSMAGQSFGDMEIIVVDDGCPDRVGLGAVLARYPDLVVIRREAAGVSSARNAGVDHARGHLVGFFDDDDRYPSDWVERHVRAHAARPDVVLTYGDVRSIDVAGRELAVDRSGPTDVHALHRREVSIIAGSMVFRRDSYIGAGGMNPLFRLAADLDLVLRLAGRGPVAYVPGLVRDYRTHPGNVTRRHRDLVACIDGILRMHRAAAIRAGRHDLVADLRVGRAANGRFAFWSAARAAGTALRSRRPLGAVGELAWAFRVAPTAPLSWLGRRLPARRDP